MKKTIRLTESELKGLITESVKGLLKENDADEYDKMTCLSALHDLVERYGLHDVMLRLGNEIGWRKLSGAVQLAFSGGGDSYERHQEMRSPFGQ